MIMIIVMILMNMFDVWSARLGHSRPHLVKVLSAAPPTHKLRTKIPDQPPSRTLPAAIILYKHCLYCL